MSRSTPYRGTLWLHAGRQEDEPAMEYFMQRGVVRPERCYKGAYIGIIELAAIVILDEEKWEEWYSMHLDPSPFRDGLYGWIITAVKRFEIPVAGKGNTSLYSPDAADLDRLGLA